MGLLQIASLVVVAASLWLIFSASRGRSLTWRVPVPEIPTAKPSASVDRAARQLQDKAGIHDKKSNAANHAADQKHSDHFFKVHSSPRSALRVVK
jgi:hypothetical protein